MLYFQFNLLKNFLYDFKAILTCYCYFKDNTLLFSMYNVLYVLNILHLNSC